MGWRKELIQSREQYMRKREEAKRVSGQKVYQERQKNFQEALNEVRRKMGEQAGRDFLWRR